MLVLNKDTFSPTLFGLYIDKLESYLDKIDRDSPCLFNTMVVILHYANDIVLLSKFGTGLQRLLNKLHEFYNSYNLEVKLSKPQQKETKPRGILPRQGPN